MNKITETSFHRTYFTFGGLFLLITLVVVAFILSTDNIEKEKLVLATSIYAFFTLILAVLFIFALKNKITTVIKSIDGIIDNAISGKNICTSYDETSISALENKMYRFVSISKSNTAAIDEERNKIKSLISDISHQTKTPIANILLYSELLLDRSTINDEEKQLAKGIKVQSEKFKWLIESLVKMSRLEVGIISANKALTSIFQTISSSIGAVFSDAEKKNIQIQVSCSEDIKAYYDSKWTSEAIINILENAIKYTTIGGRVAVTVKQYEIFTEIVISDTGIGIREDEITRIFKRFYRSKNVSQYEGVGIGLYLSREIISSQGGYIKVKSQINKGSVFSVFLPNTK
ncbi:sensor histidine kinase [Clostridium magnum]|uniref:histidine kinase n=1 Tax=Clostridium magnum DSM 2767 TaxID=1121326 RepID=A0A162QIP5_9CLOT|nr:HAMP domain-containing sensor histidine kinase [Clostridium magnum]KZL88575.1 alkaline phosphatase synthesis sensor protein PhoR [Clostridium magnum DSM 2767]SHI83189.1 Signal transduction histidine kinase [Clostridium magnum DSM 2767]